MTSDVSARTLRSLHLPAGRTDRTIACLSALNQLEDERRALRPFPRGVVQLVGSLPSAAGGAGGTAGEDDSTVDDFLSYECGR